MQTRTNASIFDRAKQVIPGGVSSPVRAFRSVRGDPKVFERGKGAWFSDVEERQYLDFVMSWGPLILGHAHARILEAVAEAASRGLSFGAPCEDEMRLAERVCAAYPACEKLRFVSSGTEAVMSALRLARGATHRDRVLKFSGCYHGHSDSMLVAAGSGLATFGKPSSDGVPEEFTKLTSVLPLDDEAKLEAFFAAHGDELAVAIIEPVPANNGLLLQRKDFLAKLATLCKKHGALLHFDEVISGFRLGMGGASEFYGITPDLATFGKVIGGGMPVGAFGGRKDLMDLLAPDGPVYQAGTLSGNPVAMAAGLATLDVLEQEDAYASLEKKGAVLEASFEKIKKEHGLPLQMTRLGSLFWLAPDQGAPYRSAESLPEDLGEQYAPLHERLLALGIYLAPSAYEVGFLSTAHSEEDIETLVAGIAEAYRS